MKTPFLSFLSGAGTRLLVLLLLPACTLLPTALQAALAPEVETLNQLVSQNRYQEAYAMATDMVEAFEGDPEFDFLYGVAALETGNPGEAVFAFERLLFTYPNQRRVKLELARAFFMTNNLDASRRLFNEVLATNPEENVRNNIEAFLVQIERREESITGGLNWYVNTNVGNDSNINSATELGVINTPIGDVQLSENGQSIDDNFFDIGAGLNYVKPLSKTSAINVTGGYNLHDNIDTDAFDIGVLSGQISYAHLVNDLRLSYGARAQKVSLDGDDFQDSASLVTTLQRNGDNGWSQALTGAWTAIRYDDESNQNAPLRDVNQWLLSGVVGKAMGSFNHTVSVYYGNEDEVREAGKDNAKEFYGIALSEQYQFRPAHTPYIRVSLQRSENKAPHVFFGEVRDDSIFSTSMGWIWRAMDNMNVTTDITYTDSDSNLDLFSYDRLRVQTGIRYQF